MSKQSDFESVKNRMADLLGKRTNVNYDELNAYILTLLQYKIKILRTDGNRQHEVLGVGPKGVICKLANALTVYYEYPSVLSYKPDAARAYDRSEFLVIIGGDVNFLFDAPAKITRPQKKNCAFGMTLQALTIKEANDDFEF